MMTSTQYLRFGDTSATLVIDCPEGRPSSVTSLVVREDAQSDDSTAETAFGSPTIESVTTTFDVASGYGQQYPNRAYLASTTGLVIGREYVATNALGQVERPIIEGISSGDYVIVQNDLTNSFASADTFTSPRISATVDATWIADDSNISDPLCPSPKWRGVWTYVVGGVTYVTVTLFDVVRYPFVTTVTPEMVDRLARGWLFRLATDDQVDGGDEVIKEAVHQVKLDLWERGIGAYPQRNSEAINELVRRKAVALVSEQAMRAGGVAPEIARADHDAYWQRVDNLFNTLKVTQQVTEDGAAGTVKRTHLSRR